MPKSAREPRGSPELKLVASRCRARNEISSVVWNAKSKPEIVRKQILSFSNLGKIFVNSKVPKDKTCGIAFSFIDGDYLLYLRPDCMLDVVH